MGAFACNDFQIPHILHDILRGIIERLVLFGVLFVQINGHWLPLL